MSDGKNLKFSELRATDLKFNKHIELPDPGELDDEALIQFQKHETIKAARSYVKEQTDEKGKAKKLSNLTREEEIGRKEVKEGVKSKGWIIYQTDKSGKMCLDSVENYTKCMEPHIKNDEEVKVKRELNAEKSINEHSRL